MRPRFVVVLCVAAVAVGLLEFFSTVSPAGPSVRQFAGRPLTGAAARAAAGLHAAVCLAAAWGLWRLKRWGRFVAMAYLALALISFLLWGAGPGGEGQLARVMGWQMFVLPFVVFCLMYLYNGARYFD